MDDRLYKRLKWIAIAMVLAWVGWSLYDMTLRDTLSGGNPTAAAIKYLEDERYQDALEAFDRVLQQTPDHGGAMRGRAQALMQLGTESEKAALTLETAARPMEARSLRQQANEHYQSALDTYDRAIAQQSAMPETGRAILGVSLANRGILKDRMGDYAGALEDYELALKHEPEVGEGPGFLTRFMRNQPEMPPTVADRARYLRQQLALPPSQRLLRLPEQDMEQRAYRM
jgi:tetratricopeptide (TPR) repeat protein